MKNEEVIKLKKVIDFAKKICSTSILEIIPVKEEDFSIINDCYNNVSKKIKSNGGNIVYGWTIHIHKNFAEISTLEAEAHAIWESSEGNKFCISPQRFKEIIFLEDKNNIVKHNETIPNYRMSLIGDNQQMKYLELQDYIRIEVLNYINDNLLKISFGEAVSFERNNVNYIIKCRDKKYNITEQKIINLLNSYFEIENFKNSPNSRVMTSKQLVEKITNKLNYKFKYFINV